ncbi:4Fe-4S dicluster domain-containing protein [Chloroflexota bacterium]
MTQMSIVFDLDMCVGCHSCTVACKMENNVRLGEFWSKVLQIGPTGTFPDLELYWLPVLCQHCRDPQCTKVCPTGASYQREDGVVLIDKDRCIGCQYCIVACSYGVRYYNEEEGVVEKCTLCAHLIDRGEEPECVKTCIAKCRIFGDIDDPNSEVSKKIREAGEENVHTLVDVGNQPSLKYILKKHTWRS